MKRVINFILAGVKLLLSPFIRAWEWFWYGDGLFCCPGWIFIWMFLLYLISLPYMVICDLINKGRVIRCHQNKKSK